MYKNIFKISKEIIQRLKTMAGFGFDLANTGWLDTTGNLHQLQRGDTHYEAAIRWIKNNSTNPKQELREFKQFAEDLDEGGGVVNYDQVYKHITNKYNLIRVSSDGFDTIMNESNLNRIGRFIKDRFYGQKYMNFYIQNAENPSDNIRIEYDTLEDVDFNVPKAIYKTRQLKRFMGQ